MTTGQQLDLTDYVPKGRTIVPQLDEGRLRSQLGKVFSLMADGAWRTLAEIESATGAPQASASARLRDIRSMGWKIDRRRRGDPANGLHEYRAERVAT